MPNYRIINSNKTAYSKDKDLPSHFYISEEGALIIWAAYEKMFGKNCQSMQTRESRGGVCHLSEIDYFKNNNALARDFDYAKYLVND